MANEITETLFKSIDTIIASRLEQLPYDQTLKCRIENTVGAANGKYIVSYQSNRFTAYSERTDFEKGDYVYVSAPKGDYTQEKHIIGKVVGEQAKVNTKIEQTKYVQVSENLNANKKSEEYYLPINTGTENKKTTVILYEQRFTGNNLLKYIGYDFLNIKASMSATAKTAKHGNYGLMVEIEYYDQTTGMVKYSEAQYKLLDIPFELGIADIIAGNPYSTNGYCNQEKMFNVSNKIIRLIRVSLYQQNNFYDNNNLFIPQNDRYGIYVTNLQISFGYSIDRLTEQITPIIYTTDGYLYNTSNNTKDIYIRLLNLSNDKKTANELPIATYYRNDNMDVQWWKFDKDSAVPIAPLNEVGYVYSSSGVSSSQSLSILSNVQLEGFIGLIIDNRGSEPVQYKTDVLKFYNNDYVESSELLDRIQGLSLTFLNSECGGVYNLYNKANQLMTDTLYHIKVQYNSVLSDRKLAPGDKITWTIPAIKSMLEKPQINIGYSPVDTLTSKLDDELGIVGSYVIEHTLTTQDFGARLDNSFLLPFTILSTYNQNYTNNTISVKVEIDNVPYEKSVDLTFGPSGTTEAEYTFTLSLVEVDDYNNQVSVNALTLGSNAAIYVKPKMISYDAEDINVKLSDIQLSWIGNADNHFICNDTTLNNDLGMWKISFASSASNNIIDYGYDILKAEINNYNGYQLVAYLPIAVRADNSYKYILGPTTVIYDITGKKAVCSNVPYQIPKMFQQGNTTYTWVFNTENGQKKDSSWPDLGTEVPELKIPSIYQKDVEVISVKCLATYNSTVTPIWVQPVLFTQNKYPTPMYNSEGYELILTNQTNSDIIKQTMVGRVSSAGNTISGMFMGIVKNPAGMETMGLYGYRNGTQFFCLDENGYIYLNGNSNGSAVDMTNMYITNSTFDNATITNGTLSGNISINTSGIITANSFVGDLTGIADSAKGYSPTGGIATAISNLQTQINNLQNQIDRLT